MLGIQRHTGRIMALTIILMAGMLGEAGAVDITGMEDDRA